MKICIVTAILFALLFFDSYSQSRVDRENVQFDSKSEKITQATGWKQNRITGKWVESQNVIADRNISPQARGVTQKFNWLQFATVTYEDEQYYLLVYEIPTGMYRYPNIQEGWISFESVLFFVFTFEQYVQMVNRLNIKSGETIKISSNMAGGYSGLSISDAGGYNEKDLLARITNILIRADNYERCFLLNSQVVNGSKVVRFRLPGFSCRSKDIMDTAYFEVDFENFYSLLDNISADLDLAKLPNISPPTQEEEEDFFIVVEDMPELIGGLGELQRKIRYPEMARRAGIEGRVYVQFIVNERGEVEAPRVMRGIGGGADEEAIRVVKLAEFRPGKENGQPVRVQYSLPIVFQLPN